TYWRWLAAGWKPGTPARRITQETNAADQGVSRTKVRHEGNGVAAYAQSPAPTCHSSPLPRQYSTTRCQAGCPSASCERAASRTGTGPIRPSVSMNGRYQARCSAQAAAAIRGPASGERAASAGSNWHGSGAAAATAGQRQSQARTNRAMRKCMGFLAGTCGRHRCRTFRWHPATLAQPRCTAASRTRRWRRGPRAAGLLTCAERLVVDVARELHAGGAHRATGIGRQPRFAEPHRQRVEMQQATGQRFAQLQQQLEGLGGLEHADYPGQYPEHAGLAAVGRGLGRRRLREQAAVARRYAALAARIEY